MRALSRCWTAARPCAAPPFVVDPETASSAAGRRAQRPGREPHEVIAEVQHHRDRHAPARAVQPAKLQAGGERDDERDLPDQREPQRPRLRLPRERDDRQRRGDEVHADVERQRARQLARAAPARAEQALEAPRRERPQHEHQRQRDQRQAGHHAAHRGAAFARDAQRRMRVGARRAVRRELRIERLRHRAAHQRRRRLQVAAATGPSRPAATAPATRRSRRDGETVSCSAPMNACGVLSSGKSRKRRASSRQRGVGGSIPCAVRAPRAGRRSGAAAAAGRGGDRGERSGPARPRRAMPRQACAERRAAVLHDPRDRQRAIGLRARGPQRRERQQAQHADRHRQPRRPAGVPPTANQIAAATALASVTPASTRRHSARSARASASSLTSGSANS